MKTFTLEWNAVTTLEDPSRQGHEALKELVGLHGKTIDLGIVTTAASENTIEQRFSETAAQFTMRLKAVGLDDLRMVLTTGVWGLTFWGMCRWSSEESEATVDQLWPIIRPTCLPKNHIDFAAERNIAKSVPLSDPKYQKWRNKWCDVYSLEAHISAGRDVFISGDVKNFKSDAKKRLEEMGVGHICSYNDALKIAGI